MFKDLYENKPENLGMSLRIIRKISPRDFVNTEAGLLLTYLHIYWT